MRAVKLCGAVALVLGSVAMARPLMAGAPVTMTPALTITDASSFNSPTNLMAGWRFNVTAASVSVNGLGVWDQGDDGLVASHQVGIWTDLGVLLASGTVPAGTGSLLENDFRIVAIPNVALGPGTYRIGAFYGPTVTDFVVPGDATATTISGISYLDRAFLNSAGGFAFPSSSNDVVLDGDFGPTFTVDPALTVASVPLPSAFSAGLVCLLGMGGVSLLRKRFAGV